MRRRAQGLTAEYGARSGNRRLQQEAAGPSTRKDIVSTPATRSRTTVFSPVDNWRRRVCLDYNALLSRATSPHMRSDLWQRGCERLASELPDQQFNTWIRPLPDADVADNGEGAVVTVRVPNRFKLDWIRNQYAGRIETVLSELAGKPVRLDVTLAQRDGGARSSDGVAAAAGRPVHFDVGLARRGLRRRRERPRRRPQRRRAAPSPMAPPMLPRRRCPRAAGSIRR